MSLYVIDAGIAVKWFLAEPHSDKAKRLLEQFQQRAVELIAESTNVFWKHTERGTLTAQEAQDNLNDLLTINLPLVPSPLLAALALNLALTNHRSAYDSLYLALAIERGCDLVTSDERLVNAVGAQFPQLKLLRDLLI